MILLHPVSNIETFNYLNYENKFNDVLSRNNLTRINDGDHVINFDDKKSKRTHWVSLFIDRSTAVYFDSFGSEYIPLEILQKIRDKSITRNIFRIQDDESIMCGFYCIPFIEYILAGKTLSDYTNLFSINHYKKKFKDFKVF